MPRSHGASMVGRPGTSCAAIVAASGPPSAVQSSTQGSPARSRAIESTVEEAVTPAWQTAITSPL